MVWTCFSDEFSCSISERKTNGFYEIDVETVEKMYDDDDGKEHVTSSTSWVLYYDGEEFVRRVKTSEQLFHAISIVSPLKGVDTPV